MAPLNVLVLAVGGNVSQGILKSLRHDNRPMRVIGADISPLQMGLYTVDRALISPWAHEATFLPWLIETCLAEKVDVILSGAEPVIMELARHEEEILAATQARCVCSPLAVLETCDDKLETCRWMARHELPQPDFADGADPHAVHSLVARVGYPLVAKPRRGGGARGLIVVEDPNDLDYVLRKPGYLFQESVGTAETEYSVGCFRDRAGNLAPSCCMRRELQSGTTFRAVLGEYPEMRYVSEAIVRELKPLGPCNVQLRDSARGPLCFEINARFSGTTPIRTHFGYREVSAALDHFLDGKAVTLPCVTDGVALRYWNELYVDGDAVAQISASGQLADPRGYPAQIDPYGHREG